jgi:hypothetical protein
MGREAVVSRDEKNIELDKYVLGNYSPIFDCLT